MRSITFLRAAVLVTALAVATAADGDVILPLRIFHLRSTETIAGAEPIESTSEAAEADLPWNRRMPASAAVPLGFLQAESEARFASLTGAATGTLRTWSRKDAVTTNHDVDRWQFWIDPAVDAPAFPCSPVRGPGIEVPA